MRPNIPLVPLNPEIEKSISKIRAKRRKDKTKAKASTSQPHTSPLASHHTILDNHIIMAERQDARNHDHEHREHERQEHREQECEHHNDGVGNCMMMIDL